jgi:hypothetical protein
MKTETLLPNRARALPATDHRLLHQDPFLEAAWYALIPFINPIDCSRKVEMTSSGGKQYNAAIPLNDNDTLNAFYNGDEMDGGYIRPNWFSKKRLASHLCGRETYYYRSRPNGLWRNGYGSFDAAPAKRLGDVAGLLHVEGRCRKYPVGVILLCADIDCHNGEKDVAAVRDWLLDRYFPGAYWEPSTGGDGVHLYVKLAYHPWQLKDRDATLHHVVDIINKLALQLDRERVTLGYDAPVDKLRGLPSLLVEKGNRLRILRSLCIKIPRFANGLQDVRSFHFAPFFLFNSFARLVRESQAQPATLADAPDNLVTNALGWEIAADSEHRPRKRGGAAISLNSVYPSYTDHLSELSEQQDAYARTMGFALAYSRHIGRVPTADEAVTEYETQGIATGTDVNGSRLARMAYVLRYVAKSFKPSKDLYGGFQTTQEALVTEIGSLMPIGLDLTYAKAQGRREAVTETDLAALLHAMRTSQGANDRTEFSQEQARRAIKTITGHSCNKNMASCLTKALKALGMIQRVGGYIPGKRGTVFRVTQPYRPSVPTKPSNSSHS